MVNTPDLSTIINSMTTDLEAELNVSIPLVGKNFLRALINSQASKLRSYYLAVADVQRNVFPDIAYSEALGGTLERFGRVKLGRNPFPAVASKYAIQVTGTPGAVIDSSTTFKSDDSALNSGILFVLDTTYTLSGLGVTTLRSLYTGLDSALDIGDTLTATSPISGIDSIVTVISEVVEPSDAETLEDYRDKIIQSFRLEPQGGAGADYRLWSADVQDVRQVYPYAKSGFPNEISLYVESTVGNGVPSGALLLEVESAIEDPTVDRPSRKPLTVFNIDYNAIEPQIIDINISGAVDFTTDIKTAIETAMELALSDVRPFVGSIDVVADKNDIFDVNKIVSIILAANPGSVFGTVTMEVDSIALSTYTFTGGEIPELNAITYV